MGGFEIAVLGVTTISVVGCITGVVITTLDKLFDRRRRDLQAELDRARERVELLEGRVTDLQVMNEQLHRNQEWTNRLLEAQEERRELTSGR